jgi:hypothetical protein
MQPAWHRLLSFQRCRRAHRKGGVGEENSLNRRWGEEPGAKLGAQKCKRAPFGAPSVVNLVRCLVGHFQFIEPQSSGPKPTFRPVAKDHDQVCEIRAALVSGKCPLNGGNL